MSKGNKPSSSLSKGTKGRKNHGPKRHLHHEIEPKALRMHIADSGVLNKYCDYTSFCLALQSRGIRSDYKELWDEFCKIKMVKSPSGDMLRNREAQDAFFANVAEIASKMKKKSKTRQ